MLSLLKRKSESMHHHIRRPKGASKEKLSDAIKELPKTILMGVAISAIICSILYLMLQWK